MPTPRFSTFFKQKKISNEVGTLPQDMVLDNFVPHCLLYSVWGGPLELESNK